MEYISPQSLAMVGGQLTHDPTKKHYITFLSAHFPVFKVKKSLELIRRMMLVLAGHKDTPTHDIMRKAQGSSKMLIGDINSRFIGDTCKDELKRMHLGSEGVAPDIPIYPFNINIDKCNDFLKTSKDPLLDCTGGGGSPVGGGKKRRKGR